MNQSDAHQSNILIVDDIPDNLSLLSQILTAHGYQVRPALTGKLALNAIRTTLPDLILLDIVMPGMDGYEVCRQLKADEATRDIPVVFMSALDETMDKVKAFEVGGVDYISKPFQEAEVLARVRTHLALRETQRHLQEQNTRLQQEIRERQRTEQALQDSEAELRGLFAAMTDVVLVLDKDGRYLKIAPTSPELLYKPADELLGKSLHEVFPPHEADRFLAVIQQGLETQQTVSIEYMLTIHDQDIWFDGRVSPISDDTVIFVAHDITERKKAEATLREAHAQLEATLNALPDLLFEIDREGRIYDFRAPHPELLYTSPQEFLGRTMCEILPREAADVISEALAEAAETGQHFGGVYPLEVPRGRSWFEISIAAKGDRTSPDCRFITLVRDITTRKQFEEELHRAKEAAEAANQAKSAFLANMSHELRTPLNAILGFAQIMAHDPHTPEAQENLGIIQRSGEHLLTLINQVLDLSKIEAEHITLNEKNVDLYCLLDELEDLFSLKAQKKRLQLLFERTDDVPRCIRTDDVKLRQVLINLLSNALKFTEEGSVELRIANCELRIEPTPHPSQEGKSEIRNPKSEICNLQFSISDTGPGIAPEEMDHLFETFAQTETGRQAQEGTGLGLPISRKFVQLMRGDITVTSEVGRGTIVRFDIQATVVEETEVESGQPIRRAIALEPGQPRHRLLIVDDTPDSRALLVTLLNPFGFELQEATNGQEAIDIWEQWGPHLIWMDLRMPVMSGYEATQQIRATDKGKDTVIIILSASSFEEERAIALSQGCDDFLRKPFREHEIFGLLHKHLGVRFVYEEGEGQKAKGKRQKAEEVLTPEAFAALPDELRVGLQHAVEVIDLETANSLVDQIREHNEPLAEALAKLVKGYRFDVLQEFLITS